SDFGSGSNLTNTVQTTSLNLTSSSKQQLNQVCRTNVGLDKWQSYLCLRDISLARKDVDTCPPHQSGRLSPRPEHSDKVLVPRLEGIPLSRDCHRCP
ncbi:unnamed protein product, partial [Brassica rapa subsp. trilocularis]